MQRTAKKTLAVLLVLCMVIGLIPMCAQAAVLDGEKYITQQLSLGEDLVLHLRASLPDKYADLAKDATGILTYCGKTETYKMGDILPDENGMYDLPVEMAVAEMTENINVVLKGKYMGMEMEAINENYSIRDYLVKIIEGDYSQTTKDLCLELLNMGAWAQLYFNHNISDLANAGYSTSATYAVPEEIPTVQRTGKVDGISFYGTSVRFLSKTAARFYFEADGAVDGYTFTIDGTEYEPVAKDGYYYIETPGINPQDMSKEITASVTDGTKTLSVNYAPIWYFIRTYNKTENEYNKGLMEAAYSYYKTAETYTTKICMDVEISTLSGSYESIGLGFYPLDFEGDINNYVDRIEIPTGTTYTVKLDQGKYLVDGEFLGIGVTVLGGPTWDATLPDGSADRHNIAISDLRLEGPEDRTIDLNFATIASGQDGTGYTNANAGGTATLADGVITIANGFFTDGYKITFNEVDTYLKLDLNFITLGNSTEQIEVGFYPHNFEGNAYEEFTDRLLATAGGTTTVYLDVSKYLVDGELPGVGFMIFGGPEWNTELEPGVYDRHSVVISNVCLAGSVNQNIDLTNAVVTTPMANANGGGTATVVDGTVSVTGGYRYDGHMITFAVETEPEVTEPEVTEPPVTEPPVEEPDTYISLDMLITTLGNSADPIEVRFYPYNYAGSVHEGYTDLVTVTAGTTTTVKLDASNYLVNGELTGIGFGIFGGPEWNDANGDRHTVTISNVKLEGEQSAVYDLSKSVWAAGQNGTGYTDANGWGSASIGSSIVITGGIRYDAHKISLVEDTNTYICMDMMLTTLGNSTDPVEVRFYAENYAGSVHEGYTDLLNVTAGEQTTVKLDLSKYLVDGEFTGIGIAIFGGPEWNTELADGTLDRHNVVISNMRLEGAREQIMDLSGATVTTGLTGSNVGGAIAVVDGSIVISGGYRYDGHKIVFAAETEPEPSEPEPTEPEPTEPPVEEPDTYISMDLLITTTDNSTDSIEVRFFPYNYAGSVGDGCTDMVHITAGTATNVKLDLNNYLVDGELTGIGFAIMSGPAWDDAEGDRHTVTISNVKLEGAQTQGYDLSKSVWASGTNAGYSWANGWGTATIGSSIVITGGIQYDGHKISLVKEPDTYIVLDMLLTTLGNSNELVEIGFYPYNFTGDINDNTDKIKIPAGTQTTVKLDLSKYLVDGAFNGIGFAIFGGPEWNSTLPDGSVDRHTLTISSVKLEGKDAKAFDLSQSVWASGGNAGYTNANGSGVAAIGETIVITNGFRYDGHKISLVEDTNTYICMDVLLTTRGNATNDIGLRFYPSNYAGNFYDNNSDPVYVTAGTTTAVKIKIDDYLVDGELPGIGVGVFGGPEWNSVLGDGSADNHTITISNIRLEGVGARTIDMRNATVSSGFGGSNNWGTAEVTDGKVVNTGGICYNGYMITFNEVDTYLKLDLLITTLGNSTDPIDVCFYPSNYAGGIGGHSDKISVTAGTTTTIYLDSSKYMVDGQLTGIGIAILGGPEWNTQLGDGSYDRHNIVISNVCLEGEVNQVIDLSNVTFSSGTNGTGYTDANGSGAASIVDGTIVITNGFRYDGHKIVF